MGRCREMPITMSNKPNQRIDFPLRFVEIEDLLVEGLVHVSSLKDDWYEYRSRHGCLVGRKNHIAYRLGDEVEVEVKSVDYYRQQIDLVTVGGGSTINNGN